MEIRQIAAIGLVFGSLSTTTAADIPREAFTRTWVGRTVLLKQTLYTLTYDERGLMGQTRRDKRDGLNVVTPFNGSHLQFDGRQKQEDVLDLTRSGWWTRSMRPTKGTACPSARIRKFSRTSSIATIPEWS